MSLISIIFAFHCISAAEWAKVHRRPVWRIKLSCPMQSAIKARLYPSFPQNWFLAFVAISVSTEVFAHDLSWQTVYLLVSSFSINRPSFTASTSAFVSSEVPQGHFWLESSVEESTHALVHGKCVWIPECAHVYKFGTLKQNSPKLILPGTVSAKDNEHDESQWTFPLTTRWQGAAPLCRAQRCKHRLLNRRQDFAAKSYKASSVVRRKSFWLALDPSDSRARIHRTLDAKAHPGPNHGISWHILVQS